MGRGGFENVGHRLVMISVGHFSLSCECPTRAVIAEAGLPRPTGRLQSKSLTRALVDQSPPLWYPPGTKKPTRVSLDDGGHLTNVPLYATETVSFSILIAALLKPSFKTDIYHVIYFFRRQPPNNGENVVVLPFKRCNRLI